MPRHQVNVLPLVVVGDLRSGEECVKKGVMKGRERFMQCCVECAQVDALLRTNNGPAAFLGKRLLLGLCCSLHNGPATLLLGKEPPQPPLALMSLPPGFSSTTDLRPK